MNKNVCVQDVWWKDVDAKSTSIINISVIII